MRKGLILLMLLCCIALPAAGEETADFAAQWYEEQAALLIPAGVEAARQEQTYALTLPDGSQALSLCLTVEGDIRFGRYAQITRTALLAADTGEALGLEAVFSDVEALQAALDAYVEENLLDNLNTYLDVNDLLPVPLDAVCFGPEGVAFHYPAERFMFFSGHSGALHLKWYELEGLLALSIPDTEEMAAAREGRMGPVSLGDSMADLLERFGSLTDPDLVTGGELYEFESPLLRGLQAVADETGAVIALRSARFDLDGLQPGASREEAESLLGAPASATALDGGAAQYLRVRPGTVAAYTQEHCLLKLYYDESGTLYLAETAVR